MNARNQTRKLAFEQVENREMMAGNVQAAMYGNELVIQGDNQSNVIEVTEIGNNLVQIKATHGTTINGGTLAYFYNPSDNINAYMNGGDDTLMISSNLGRIATFNKVYADLGSGNDYLGFWGTSIHSPSTVIMGQDWENDADTLYVGKNPFNSSTTAQANFWSNLDIKTGGGNDLVTFRDANVFRDMTLKTESGHDTVRIDRLNAYGYFYTNLGSGNDEIVAYGLADRGDVWISGGSDDDLYRGPKNRFLQGRVNLFDRYAF